MSTYCISDIHGQYDAFISMLVQIQFNEEKDKLYILGDLVDWGDAGIKLVKYCMDSNKKNDSIEVLKGNHEIFMINYYSEKNKREKDFCKLNWFYNRGETTYLEFEKEDKNSKKEILEWLGTRKYYIPNVEVNERKFYLCHSYLYIDTGNEAKDLKNVVWKRISKEENPLKENGLDEFYENPILVAGHTITEYYNYFNDKGNCKIFKDLENSKILIDCGAKCLGEDHFRLACLRLDDLKEYYVRYEYE